MDRDELIYYYNLQLAMYGARFDDDEDGEEPTVKKHGGGRYGLPYGLCKSVSIDVPKGATPTEAWDLLVGKTGISPKEAYNTMKAEGKADNIVAKLKQASAPKKKIKITTEHMPETMMSQKLAKSTMSEAIKTINDNSGAHTDAVELFSNLGKVFNKMHQKGAGVKYKFPLHNDANAFVKTTYGGTPVEISIPHIKKGDPIGLYKTGTICHELGHVIDAVYHGSGGAWKTNTYKPLEDAINTDGRELSDNIKEIFKDNMVQRTVKTGTLKKEHSENLQKLNAKYLEDSKGVKIFSSEYTKLHEEYKKNFNKELKRYREEHHKVSCMNPSPGMTALEGFFDSLNYGKVSAHYPGLYGHSKKYFQARPEASSQEMFADYMSLKLCYPKEYDILKKEKPHICEAFDSMIAELNEDLKKG